MEKQHREEANVKRQIAALLMGAALCATMPAAAENMRIGDQAVVTKEKEDAVLRAEANDAADELVHVSAGQSVIYIAPEKGGYAQVEAAGVRGYLPADRLESQTTRGTPFSITEEERHNVNLFLTNFTETGMARYEPTETADGELVRFAVLHAWLNQSERWEYGEWGNRLAQNSVSDTVLRYFGRPLILPDQPDFQYDGAYYYMTEPGAPVGLGFACVSEVEMLGGGLYRVYFGVYGMGEMLGDDVYDLLPEQAARLYAGAAPLQGCAVIRTLGLSAREGFILESLRIE